MRRALLRGSSGRGAGQGRRRALRSLEDARLLVADDVRDDVRQLLGTRDLPLTGAAFRAVFRDGLLGLLDHWLTADDRAGHFSDVDLRTFERDLARIFAHGTMPGDERHAPEDLIPSDAVVRDGGIGTIGGGNHFVRCKSSTTSSIARSPTRGA